MGIGQDSFYGLDFGHKGGRALVALQTFDNRPRRVTESLANDTGSSARQDHREPALTGPAMPARWSPEGRGDRPRHGDRQSEGACGASRRWA